jgi:AcrR family transcriptional regulator
MRNVLPSTSKSDRQGPNSRSALIEAAIEEFSQKGYAAATLADIAARAGVTTGAVYAHFESKLDLLVEALGLRTAKKFVDVAFKAGGDDASRGLTDNLAAGLLSAPLGRRGLILLDVIVFARRDADVAAALGEMVDVRQRTFERMTAAAVDAGVIDPELAYDELGRLVMAVAFGTLVQRALAEPAPSNETIALLTERLLRPAPAEAQELDPALARVLARSRTVAEAQAALHDAIAEAAAAGHSLRALARAAGVSHERVRVILAEHGSSP